MIPGKIAFTRFGELITNGKEHISCLKISADVKHLSSKIHYDVSFHFAIECTKQRTAFWGDWCVEQLPKLAITRLRDVQNFR